MAGIGTGTGGDGGNRQARDARVPDRAKERPRGSALKDELGIAAARRLADVLAAASPAFDRRRFVRGLAAELDQRELMARVDLLAERLEATLPDAFADAAEVLWAALDSPALTGWITLPCGAFVARRGLDRPITALALLAGLTPRFSSEFAIRPFVEQRPEPTYEQLRRWTTHEDEHVRRLVSEGTRPRLPWGRVLRPLVADPSPNLPLLEALVEDPSPYVRRSVANHLNDISKDHPSLALDLARSWAGRGDGARWVVRHGLRTLVKRGDPAALSVLGVTTDVPVEVVAFTVEPARLRIGEALTLTATLACACGPGAGGRPVDAIIDYRIHHMGARGPNAPKVFKLTRRTLAPGEPVTVTRRHALADTSTRRIRPGPHTIDLQVNGIVLATAVVEVA